MSEGLDAALVAVNEFAMQRKTPIIFGTVDADMTHPVVQFEPDVIDADDEEQAPGFETQRFLAALEPFDVQAIVVHVIRARDEDWEGAQEAWAEVAEMQGNEEATIVAAGARSILEKSGKRVGEVAELTVAVITQRPALLITFTEEAPWNLAVMRYHATLKNYRQDDDGQMSDDERAQYAAQQESRRRMEEEARARDAEHRKWSGARRNEIVTQLAQHPDFPRAKKEEARIFLFSRLVGDDMPTDRELARVITREALAMYELEIKPKK